MSKFTGYNWSSESAAAAVGRFNIRKTYNTAKSATKGRKRPLKIKKIDEHLTEVS